MRKFDLITVLLTAVGKLQARRLAKALRREASLKAAIQAATEGYQAAVKDRCDIQFADLSVKR
ncbi:hypothetical protein HOT51_gp20 [Pseudomonas phage PFP1]|uniref:Uncharacterized protein n=2 Tax=Pfluvirus TaxID=3424962 RepID=A0A2Z4QIX5_9CAUD|nr:hypothetical protein HOT19_gp27 [Pseudomonas phage 22PfluR64PP]YP_009804001.1 hypothetical protein HOT51_gp20 [Pseudomonas phage PFP1]AWH14607.1 hypothetical protein [Pseudomonas phage 22PfluR64PP]AWY10470.1 hypothetical protein PFP1_20 [Pseudomonas phage PFP1]